MKIKFQADADIDQTIVKMTLRRRPAVDFQSARVAELAGKPDPEVLRIAAREGRVLVTHDQSTMPPTFTTSSASRTAQEFL